MANVVDVIRKAEAEAKQDLLIFNPLSEDIECKYDNVVYAIPSKENKAFKTPIAKHIGNYLVDLYCNTKEKNYPREKAERLIFPND